MIKTAHAVLLAAFIILPGSADAARCALVNGEDDLLAVRVFGGGCPPDLPAKSWRWLPAPIADAPDYDPATEIVEGPVYVVTEKGVVESYTVRDKTAQEISDEKDAVLNAMNIATFRALCHLKNEIRTKVESLQAWSQAQCLSAFKSLLP